MSESNRGTHHFFIPNCSGELLESQSENDESHTPERKKLPKADEDRSVSLCHVCQQNVLDPKTKWFRGLADGALEEEAALTDDRLLLYCDGEVPEIDLKPLHRVTHFSVFDGEGHLCPFDAGLIENDQLIFFSGYIKPIYDDDPSPSNGVPAQELGPILEWWISGFDGGDSFLLAFATPYAEYILMEPSPDYGDFMRMPKQKALLTKIVVEYLSTSCRPTYEGLLNRISEVSVPEDIEPFDEHSLGRHAQFIIDQVREVDDKKKLMTTPAVQEIVRAFKVNIKSSWTGRKKLRFKRPCKATTTPLVKRTFRFFEAGQRGFVANPALSNEESPKKSVAPPSACKKLSKFSWEVDSDFALVNDEVISIGNFVFINTGEAEKRTRMFRVEYFFQQNFTKQVHCSELIKGTETILGEAGNPNEFFFLEECGGWPICKIMGKARVAVKEPPKSWREFTEYRLDVPRDEYFVQKKYSRSHGSFEDLRDCEIGVCGVCRRAAARERASTPVPTGGVKDASGTSYDKIIWQNEEYSRGCCIFLEPFSVVFDAQKSSRRIEKTLVTLKTDELIYPEIYRKAKEVSLAEECPEPFVVAYVKKIFSRSEGVQKKLFLTVNKFYRPENTRVLEAWDERLLDFRLLFWSEEEAEVAFDHVRGRCDVVFAKTAPEVSLHIQFYFNSGFDAESETFYEAAEVALDRRERKPVVAEKLKTLNAFSGCGGLAEGLRQSDLADFVWAVEIDKATCKAFKSNFPNVLMFEKDCNLFLREVLSGKLSDESGNRYPVRGEIEFLCGGPPCQGFSTMNRFTAKDDSQYNNSLILTYLSFCDHYRPKFFLMENVRNFASFKKSIFLKHALACLIAMGYQCTFGVLQAGNYGLPQCRRRLFILAAAPGLPLPYFPEPTHVFYEPLKNVDFEVSGVNYCNRFSKKLSRSAPYRNVTIRDAAYDLRRTSQADSSSPARGKTFYEKFLMGRTGEIQDHLSKEMSPINEARIKHIPASKGCDWRDLPNIRVRLRDGTVTDLLRYSYHDPKNGKSCCGLLRGVCCCVSGRPCDPKNRQSNTLIPWFLVHTANRNNNWNGLYGRLDWDGVFNTVTTNPEPSSQQGKVLHPEEDRTISVRECARAQGLPDSFKFSGTVNEKFKQVGNAVPSPVARAIGIEIRKCLVVDDSPGGVF